jgi:hypothetical protein
MAAACAAALTAWLASDLLAAPAVPPAAAALAAAAAVLVLPRLGWAAVCAGLAVAAVSQQQFGAAMIILAAGALPVLVLPGSPTAWPLAAIAPALGLVGLAGAWPALAAHAGNAWRRAALGALGWVWLLVAGAIAGRGLYLPRLPGVPEPDVWTGSLYESVHHVLGAFASTGALAPVAVWAAAAVAAPWLVGSPWVALDAVRVVVWAALVAAATPVAVVAAHGSNPIGAAPTAVIGAVAGAAVVLAPTAVAAWGAALHSSGSAARVP